MKTAEFDYELPPERIAQEPLPDRTAARMMVLDRAGGRPIHTQVAALPDFLRAGDLLVLNDTRVIPARIFGRRDDTGGRVELLLVEEIEPGRWVALWRAGFRPRPGMKLTLAGGAIRGEVADEAAGGRVTVDLASDPPLTDVLDREGFAPVPPYIRRPRGKSRLTDLDRARYQTVFARRPGAVAAPTAGLHFSKELLAETERRGIRHTAVTLHVGPGTFLPVRTDEVERHVMEEERYEITAETVRAVNACRESGGRVVAVGSTVVRTLETAAGADGRPVCARGRTALFIRPPYEFKVVGAMLTNFHLPRSTLLMMVCAFAGREAVLAAYREAIRLRYRFYSYGDCMLIV